MSSGPVGLGACAAPADTEERGWAPRGRMVRRVHAFY